MSPVNNVWRIKVFRRNNQQNKDQDPQPRDQNVRKEAELQNEDQNSILAMGNEAMNRHPSGRAFNRGERE